MSTTLYVIDPFHSPLYAVSRVLSPEEKGNTLKSKIAVSAPDPL